MTGRKKCLVDSVSRTHVQKKKKQTNTPREKIQNSVLKKKKKKKKNDRRNNTIFCFSLLRCIYANTRHKLLLVKNGTLQNLQVY